MESLNRLLTLVLNDVPLVRRLKNIASSDAPSLDLTYITERLVLVGTPHEGNTDKKRNVTNINDLVQYLTTFHHNHYLIVTLNAVFADSESDEALQKTQSMITKLHEQILEFNWERDGMIAHTPPLDLIFRICYALDAYLSIDPRNVVFLNCRTGKTRCGVVVACYLLFAQVADDPIDAFVEFYRKRWDMKSLTPQTLLKKTPPSIQRFLTSFQTLRATHKPENNKPLVLKTIIFRQLPVELQPCVQIWDDYKLVFCTDDALHEKESREVPVLDWNEEDGFFAILWENGVELDGGFSLLCSFGEEYDNEGNVDAALRVLFRYVNSTLFLLPGLVTLKKHDLDMMKQYEHGFDEDQFSVDLLLHETTPKKPRNSVRMDYLGSSAVRQGLIEITKHHVVLPDSAMQSSFMRTGFGETPVTFALQCSQNVPNVAYDLLHSEGLVACFVQETMGSVSEENAEELEKYNQNVDLPAELDCCPTTAEVAAMQSQRSRYSTQTVVDSSLCDTCRDDDDKMRPQIVQCVGQCGKYYHTSCVGLHKIPFGLTTTSDCTNHTAYVNEMFNAWECDACVSKSSRLTVDLPGGEMAANMKVAPSFLLEKPTSATSANSEGVAEVGNAKNSSETRDSLSVVTDKERQTTICVSASEEFNQLEKFMVRNGLLIEDLLKPVTSPSTTAAVRASTLAPTTLTVVTTPSGPSNLDMKAALSNKVNTARRSSDGSEACAEQSVDNKYALMLKRGVPFEAVQNCMQKDQVDPSTLKPLPSSENTTCDISSAHEPSKSEKVKLKDVEVFSTYFRMVRMGCPKEAVKQKVIMDGCNPIILDLGPDAIYDEVKDRIAIKQSVLKVQDGVKCVKPLIDQNAKGWASEVLLKDAESAIREKMKADGVDVHALSLGGEARISKLLENAKKDESTAIGADLKLKDDPKYAKYFKMLFMGLSEGFVRRMINADGMNERILTLGGDAFASQLADPIGGNNIKLQEDPVYAKFFEMLKMGISKDVVRQNMKSEGIDDRALDLGGDAHVSALVAPKNDNRLEDDPVYAKYFKMLKMGLSEGAVRQKMATDNIDARVLELGPDANVSMLDSIANAKCEEVAALVKPKRMRKKLHWQAISEDRLSSVNQQTIWEDEDDDVSFDVDMAELEVLFFANQDPGNAKKNASRGQSKSLKRRQTVTLIDGKRAMNAAISLARIKLAYSEIAEAVANFDSSGLTIEQAVAIYEFLPTSEEAVLVSGYTGDKEMLGEAEKFILEIAKIKRYRSRMECLVLKLSFSHRSAELVTSLSRLQKAGEEVKCSRLLKTLLAMVLKLGNTLNGSGEGNWIKGFTVDSLLRLGHTKAINQKTTVLHYLVRLVKKNHPPVLDFQAELQSVPLAARESFQAIDTELTKLGKELASVHTELGLLEKQAVETSELEVTIKSMQSAAVDIETRIRTVDDRRKRAREEVSSVLEYFGEDPKRSPTEFFTTLASFCTMFQRARNEVDSADETARRAERLKMRRLNTSRVSKTEQRDKLKVSRSVLDYPQTECAAEKRHCDDN